MLTAGDTGAHPVRPSRADSAKWRPTPESTRLRQGERLRLFDLYNEDPERLISLKEEVYGAPVNRPAFQWQYFGHPQSKEIRVYVVDSGPRLIASTTRVPAVLHADGVARRAFFSIDSMVHPTSRRLGLMRELYLHSRRQLGPTALVFSKGSSDAIYPLLMSLGQRELTPNTRLVYHPSLGRWLLSHLHLQAAEPPPLPTSLPGFEDFHMVDRFGTLFDSFFEHISQRPPSLFVRDSVFMNWRYIQIPHRRYTSFQRIVDGRVTSVVVMRTEGEQGKIVDLLWDTCDPSDPERTIQFAQAFLQNQRATRIVCFATHPLLRGALAKAGFVDRGETPRLSIDEPSLGAYSRISTAQLHVVDGDGDTEFC